MRRNLRRLTKVTLAEATILTAAALIAYRRNNQQLTRIEKENPTL